MYDPAKVFATLSIVGAVLDAAALTEAESGVVVASILSSGADVQDSLDPITYIDRVAKLAKFDQLVN